MIRATEAYVNWLGIWPEPIPVVDGRTWVCCGGAVFVIQSGFDPQEGRDNA